MTHLKNYILVLSIIVLLIPSATAQNAAAKLPDTPAGKKMAELLSIIETEDGQKVLAFIRGFAKPFLEHVPEKQHMQVMEQLHDTTGGFADLKVEQSSPYHLVVTARAKQGDRSVKIELQTEETPPHAIALLGFRPVEATRAAEAKAPSAPIASNAEINRRISEYLNSLTPKGLSGSVLVARGDQIVFHQAYGMADRAKGIRNTPETVFHIGSIAKQFTAAAIMKLEMQGKLNTSDPIGKYFDNVPADKQSITLHHLLTMTSGVMVSPGPGQSDAVKDRDRRVLQILEAPLNFTPGQRYEYSNGGYNLLAAIVEKASGQSFNQFLYEQLFRPAGLQATGFNVPVFQTPDWEKQTVARVYKGETDNGYPWANNAAPWFLTGPGSILSTTGDLFKWHLALLGDKVLSPAAKKKLYTPVLDDYAYGWTARQTSHGLRIQHNGGTSHGTGAFLIRYVDTGVTIVLCLNNSGMEFLDPLSNNLTRLVFDADQPENTSAASRTTEGQTDAPARITTEIKADAPAKIEEYLTRLTPFGFSGSVLVAKDDRVLFQKAYGMADRAKGVANTTDTLFDTGSVAKQFTAAAIFKLEMLGKLNSSDSIGKYLDGVPPDKQAITIFQLLSHTSGVMTSQNIYAGDNFSDRDKRVKQILDAPLLFKPGERYDYSNAGYNLAAAIIEKASGQSYQQFLYENLFKPSGMTSTMFQTGHFAVPGADKKTVARLYAGARDNGVPRGKENLAWFLTGPGGILTTPGDFLKWHQALNGDKVLSVDAKKKYYELAATVGTMRDSPYGRQVSHGGGTTMGTGATFARFLDAGVLIATCLNNSGEEFNEVVTRAIVSALFGRELNMPPAIVSISPAAMSRVTGTFDLPSGGKLTAFVADGQLNLSAEDGKGLAALFEARPSERYKQLEERTLKLVEASVKHDYEPMRQAMISPLALDRLTAREQKNWQEWQAKHGGFKGFVIIGTTPEPMNDAAVNVRFDFERGSVFTQYVWFPRGLDERRLSPGAPAKVFFPASETDFVSYNLVSGATTRISFKLDAKGKATGIELKNRDQASPVVNSASSSTVTQKSDQKSDLGKFPDTPSGRVAAAYFKAFNSGDEKVMKEFFLNHLSKASLAGRPMVDRLKVYHQIHGDLGKLDVDSVSDATAQGITVKAQINGGGEVEFRFMMDPEEPNKLKGIGVERR